MNITLNNPRELRIRASEHKYCMVRNAEDISPEGFLFKSTEIAIICASE